MLARGIRSYHRPSRLAEAIDLVKHGALPLAGGTRSVSLQVLPPGDLFIDPRVVQVDFRVSKSLQIGGARLQPAVDVFNLLNNNAVIAVNQTYGARWLNPTQIITARLVKVGLTVNF